MCRRVVHGGKVRTFSRGRDLSWGANDVLVFTPATLIAPGELTKSKRCYTTRGGMKRAWSRHHHYKSRLSTTTTSTRREETATENSCHKTIFFLESRRFQTQSRLFLMSSVWVGNVIFPQQQQQQPESYVTWFPVVVVFFLFLFRSYFSRGRRRIYFGWLVLIRLEEDHDGDSAAADGGNECELKPNWRKLLLWKHATFGDVCLRINK